MKNILIYLSPAKTTEKIVSVVQNILEENAQECVKFNLYRKEDYSEITTFINESEKCCIWFFTPVYVDHPLPQIMRIIDSINQSGNKLAVITATWGGVSSGLAIYDMYNHLSEKNIKILGAGKVLAQHSSMWGSSRPLNEGKPNTEDLEKVKIFTENILYKICESNNPKPLKLDDMDYQTKKMKSEAEEKNLDIAKDFLPPKVADEKLCTQCGKCISVCPVFALNYRPQPKSDDNCIMCNNCVKICPENAFEYDHNLTEKIIYEMSQNSDEPKTTEFFT